VSGRNVVLLVVDSLRAQSLGETDACPRTPFLHQLGEETLAYRRAYATECWTLPTHVSMFTGRLPSSHGAHFQSMGYVRPEPTLAEVLSAAGYSTDLVTRNFVFDGTIPGIVRGFQRRHRPLAPGSRANLAGVLLTLAKPRVRRYIRRTGFFHPRHSDARAFVTTFARSLLPADDLALARVLEVMERGRRRRRPYFVCCNLYDVHAPYPPARDSLFGPWRSLRGVVDNVRLPIQLARLGQHAYLRDGFHVSAHAHRALRDRYHAAIGLMDEKLAAFYDTARACKLLDDTVLIITSDHGEAFGEHGLYLHDASVFNTHLHVPLWIRHPDLAPAAIEDVVSTRDLFGLIRAVARRERLDETIVDADYRARHSIALAEHFYYPRLTDAAPQFRQNLIAAVSHSSKVILRGDSVLHYDLLADPAERAPTPEPLEAFARSCRAAGTSTHAANAAVAHLKRFAAGLVQAAA